MVLLYCHHLCHYFLNLCLPSISVHFIHTLGWLGRNCYSSSLGLWSQSLLLPSQPPALSPSSPAPDFSFLHLFSSRQCDCAALQASCSCQVMPLSLSPTVEMHWSLLSQLLLWSYLVTPCVCLSLSCVITAWHDACICCVFITGEILTNEYINVEDQIDLFVCTCSLVHFYFASIELNYTEGCVAVENMWVVSKILTQLLLKLLFEWSKCSLYFIYK